MEAHLALQQERAKRARRLENFVPTQFVPYPLVTLQYLDDNSPSRRLKVKKEVEHERLVACANTIELACERLLKGLAQELLLAQPLHCAMCLSSLYLMQCVLSSCPLLLAVPLLKLCRPFAGQGRRSADADRAQSWCSCRHWHTSTGSMQSRT